VLNVIILLYTGTAVLLSSIKEIPITTLHSSSCGMVVR
jgi:hypothetical protein